METETLTPINIAPTYHEKIAPMMAELKAANALAHKQLEVYENLLKVAAQRFESFEQRADKTLLMKDVKGVRDTKVKDILPERSVSAAVAAALEESTVIICEKYKFKNKEGDLDGLVSGKLDGKQVVVLVKAVPNMDSNVSAARDSLEDALNYWLELAAADPESQQEVDEKLAADRASLEVEKLRGHEVLLAFGGKTFSKETASKQLGPTVFRKRWFRVAPSGLRKLMVAELWE